MTVRSLEKRFGHVVALENLDLEILDKEFVTLLGPSGCGKTTTLRLIAGLEEPTKGDIYFDGQSVTHLPPNSRDIAMVFQSYALYPHMSVYDNIGFALRMMRVPREEIRNRVENAARKMGIIGLLHRKPRELSGGQRQRVALGRAIVREPAAYLLDEPLSNLDAQLRVLMRAELKKLHLDLRRTFIYVTHDQSEALTMSDRIAVMNQGKLLQYGSPDEIYNRPRNRIVASLVGNPPMNFLDGELTRKNGRLVFERERFLYPLPEELASRIRGMTRQVTFGIRPESIEIVQQCSEDMKWIDCTVYIGEPMGSDLLLTVDLGDGLLKVRTHPDFRTEPGAKVYIYPKPAKVHFFDQANGLTLT